MQRHPRNVRRLLLRQRTSCRKAQRAAAPLQTRERRAANGSGTGQREELDKRAEAAVEAVAGGGGRRQRQGSGGELCTTNNPTSISSVSNLSETYYISFNFIYSYFIGSLVNIW